MHDIKWIRDNANVFDAALKRRGLEPLSPSLLAIDEQRRAAILASEQAQARRNSASKEIGDAKKAKDDARAAVLMAEVAELKVQLLETEVPALLEEAPDITLRAFRLPSGKMFLLTDVNGNFVRIVTPPPGWER